MKQNFLVREPSMAMLRTKEFCLDCIRATQTDKVILIDIGGYFSNIAMDASLPELSRVLGIIEDTENGHTKYATVPHIRVPVISVARSNLKIGEDTAVGSAILFSLERALRERGDILQPLTCLVMGFGKVGRGVALALRSRGARVLVFDVNPIRRIEALGWGFAIPDRSLCIGMAGAIFGATGKQCLDIADIMQLPDGALLISASSKDVEFPVEAIRQNLAQISGSGPFEDFATPQGYFSLVSGGTPLNFRDGGVVGPLLALTQAEILIGIQMIASQPLMEGLQALPAEEQARIAQVWLKWFIREDGTSL